MADRDITIKEPNSHASEAQMSLIDDLMDAGVISEDEYAAFNKSPLKQAASDLIGAHTDDERFGAVLDARRERREAAGAEAPEATSEKGEGGSFKWYHPKLPHEFVREVQKTARDGHPYSVARVTFPPSLKVNGMSIGGFQCEVPLNATMRQQMLSGKPVSVPLRVGRDAEGEDISIHIFNGPRSSPTFEEYDVPCGALAQAIPADRVAFANAKQAEREGVSLDEAARESRDSSDALSGRDANERPEQTR